MTDLVRIAHTMTLGTRQCIGPLIFPFALRLLFLLCLFRSSLLSFLFKFLLMLLLREPDETRLGRFELFCVFIPQLDLIHQRIEVAVDPDIADTSRKNIVKTVQRFDRTPLPRDSRNEDRRSGSP